MAASYPGSVKSFTQKVDGVNKVYAADINDITAEVTAVETDLIARNKIIMLSAPLQPSAWNPMTLSTTAKTLINLATVFGTPANIKAIIVEGSLKDTGGSTTETRFVLGPNNTSLVGTHWMGPISNTRYASYNGFAQCNVDGNIYYQAVASGTNTMTVYIQILGYVI